jgi:chemotaxis protein MotA
MKITQVIGILLLSACLGAVFMFESVSFGTGVLRLLHWPAILLTGVGPLALVLICFDLQVIKRAFTILKERSPGDFEEVNDKEAIVLQKTLREFYAKGPVAFENVSSQGLSEQFQKTMEKLTVRIPLKDIRELLEVERERKRTRLIQVLNLINMGARLAPSIGMLGTILGMVRLLSTLQDPSQIGSHMSLALLTTFYGLFFSIVVWTPFQQKIERLTDVELEGFDQILAWLELLERRKPVDYFSEAFELPNTTQAA